MGLLLCAVAFLNRGHRSPRGCFYDSDQNAVQSGVQKLHPSQQDCVCILMYEVVKSCGFSRTQWWTACSIQERDFGEEEFAYAEFENCCYDCHHSAGAVSVRNDARDGDSSQCIQHCVGGGICGGGSVRRGDATPRLKAQPYCWQPARCDVLRLVPFMEIGETGLNFLQESCRET